MPIKSGRYGEVSWDPAGTTAVPLISIKQFKASFKTDHINVTCFGDENKVYVPGMKDITGTFGGFWNSDGVELFEAVDLENPGLLKLVPNTTEPGFNWSGLAYLDAEIDTNVEGAPAVSGTFMAANTWAFAHAAGGGLARGRRGQEDAKAAA